MKIAFIGGGVMAEAIIGGIVDAGITPADSISVGEPVESRRGYLEDTYGLTTHADNLEAVDGASLTILAVKPQSLPYVFPQLAGKLSEDNTVLSIVAGANMTTLTSGLAHDAVIRVMPNTPAQIGAGMTMWTASNSVSESGEGRHAQHPADTWRRGLCLRRGHDRHGDRAERERACLRVPLHRGIDRRGRVPGPRAGRVEATGAIQTVLGSTQLVKDSGKHPAELKDMVTSPGGTTIEALRAFEDGGFRAAVFGAVSAAYEKSRALGG